MYRQTPYTYSKLIQGWQCSKGYCEQALAKLTSKRKPSTDDAALVKYYREQISYFKDEIARLSLARLVCGDSTAIIR